MSGFASLPKHVQRKIRVDAQSGCWLWQGYKNEDGYGIAYIPPFSTLAHRAVFSVLFGAPDQDMDLHHRCPNKDCCNPEHLAPLHKPDHTMMRSHEMNGKFNSAKTQCPVGHAYNEANTYINKRGGRICRRCALDRYYRRKLNA